MSVIDEAKEWLEYNDVAALQGLPTTLVGDLFIEIEKRDKVIESGLMTRGTEKPYRITMCNTFYPKSAMDKDVTLCIDITEALSQLED